MWLDDLDLYLGSDGLNVGMVQRMLAEPRHRIIIVATMSSHAHARFSARHVPVEGDLIHDVVCTGREVQLARMHRLERIWSPGEVVRARSLATDTRIAAAVRHAHLGRRGALFAAKTSLIRAVGMSGRHRQAVVAYDKLTVDCTKILGPDHPLTLHSRNGHARFLGDAGHPQEAAALFEIIVIDRTRVLGHTHPYTLNSRNGHANFVGRAGDPARATRLLQAILADRIRLFGTDHPWTVRTRSELTQFITGS